MTVRQRNNLVKRELYRNADNENSLWATVYANTLKRYKWETEEKVAELTFIKKMQKYNICRELKISNVRTYYYYLDRICGTAYLWACELKLI